MVHTYSEWGIYRFRDQSSRDRRYAFNVRDCLGMIYGISVLVLLTLSKCSPLSELLNCVDPKFHI